MRLKINLYESWPSVLLLKQYLIKLGQEFPYVFNFHDALLKANFKEIVI